MNTTPVPLGAPATGIGNALEPSATCERGGRLVRKSDAEIKQAVVQELKWNTRVDETKIGVSVDRGVITLVGTVDHYAQVLSAEEAIQYLPGVRGITNEIQIRVPKVLAHDVRKSIEEAIVRHAHREAMHLKLDVYDGRVTVAGVVPSLAEKRAVLGAARQTPGVRFVEDLLRIGPS